MNIRQNCSRIPLKLRQELVAEVKSCLKAGMEFNEVYGELLAMLEKASEPTLETARILLQCPEAILECRARKRAAASSAQELLREQIVQANIPKTTADRDRLVADTLEFLTRLPQATPLEIKAVTLLRQLNGNRDPQIVNVFEIASAEDLASNLDCSISLGESAGRKGPRYSRNCNAFLLMEGETLSGFAVPAPKASSPLVPTLI